MKRILIICSVFILLASLPTFAAVLKVGPGQTYAHPQDAVNAALEGDKILVYPGTYGSRDRGAGYSGSDRYAPALIVYKSGLTIKAVDPDRSLTIIQSTHLFWSNPIAVIWSTNGNVVPPGGIAANGIAVIADNVTIEGFTVRSYENNINTAAVLVGALFAGEDRVGISRTKVRNCDLDGHGGIRLWNAPHTTIEHNLIKNNIFTTKLNAPVVIHDGDNVPYPGSTKVAILNNQIYDTQNWAGIELGGLRSGGSYVDHSELRIKGNIIRTSNGHGIWAYHSNIDKAEIAGNIISPDPAATAPKAGITLTNDPPFVSILIKDNKIIRQNNALNLWRVKDSTIDHNEFRDCKAWGANIVDSDDVTVTNNFFFNNGNWPSSPVNGRGGLCVNASKNVVAHYNRIFNNNSSISISGGAYNALKLGEDPLLYVVDATNNWWGDTAGPYHSSSWIWDGTQIGPNSGAGNKVNDYILYKPWLAMVEEAKIDWKKKENDDKVVVKGILWLPLETSVNQGDLVTFAIGNFTQTIPMDVNTNGDKWEFKRDKGATGIKNMRIDWKEDEAKFEVHIDDAELGSGWANPVLVTIRIGNFIRSELIAMQVHKDKWEYHK